MVEELAELRDRGERLVERDRASAAELARRESALQAPQQLDRGLREQLDASAAWERELGQELSRAQAALEAAHKAHEGDLERARARLKFQLQEIAQQAREKLKSPAKTP